MAIFSYLVSFSFADLTKFSWRCCAKGHKPGRGGSAKGRVLEAELPKGGGADAPYTTCHTCVTWPSVVPHAHRPIHVCSASRNFHRRLRSSASVLN